GDLLVHLDLVVAVVGVDGDGLHLGQGERADGLVVDLDHDLVVLAVDFDVVLARSAEYHQVAVAIELGDGPVGAEQQQLAALLADERVVAHGRVGLDVDQPGAGAVQGGDVDDAAGLPAPLTPGLLPSAGSTEAAAVTRSIWATRTRAPLAVSYSQTLE